MCFANSLWEIDVPRAKLVQKLSDSIADNLDSHKPLLEYPGELSTIVYIALRRAYSIFR